MLFNLLIFNLIIQISQAQTTQSCGLNCEYTIESSTITITVDGLIDSALFNNTNNYIILLLYSKNNNLFVDINSTKL